MPYALDKAKILVVDDMTPMLALTRSILETCGFKHVFTATSGEEAFELVCKHDPDLILTDWVMEPIDGLEFAKNVRHNPLSPNPYVPILMMTGYGSKPRVESSRDAGITEFLIKPFTSKDLCARIVQIIEKPRQFVETQQFFGPDRRRRKAGEFEEAKRGDDPLPETNTDILKKLHEETKTIS